MVSRKNPNGPSKIRQAARAGKVLKEQQRKSAAGQHKISKDAINRGARVGLMPNSGVGAPMSSKKRRKVEKAMAHALKRKMEAEGVVEMKDVPASKTAEKAVAPEKVVEEMDIE